jgi:hypothetical protein
MSALTLSGWHPGEPGFSKVEVTKLIHGFSELGLTKAKSLVDRMVDGEDVELIFGDRETAESFIETASKLGVRIRTVSVR